MRRAVADAGIKFAVVDDDPTGTQTVRDVPLVTSWSDEDLAWAVAEAAPVFGVLTNSRALAEEQAAAANFEIGGRLAAAARRCGVEVRVISRSDSTLRGHFPAEVEALAAGLAGAGERTDVFVVCPAFPEAGRITVDDVHWLVRGDRLVPVASTEFARDAAFGYHSANLCDWVRERAGAGTAVAAIGLDELRGGGAVLVAERLLKLAEEARWVVVNAAEAADLEVLSLGLTIAEERGLRAVLRSGPSLVSARAGLAPAEPLADAEIAMPGVRGLVVVGSHTALTTAQLEVARRRLELPTVTLDARDVLDPGVRNGAVQAAVEELLDLLRHGDAALVTSRAPVDFRGPLDSLAGAATIGDALSEAVGMVARHISLGWLLAKGGITSHDLAARALGARRMTVLGQLFPGQVSVWELGAGSACPGLRYVVFPGNVGDEEMLANSVQRLRGGV